MTTSDQPTAWNRPGCRSVKQAIADGVRVIGTPPAHDRSAWDCNEPFDGMTYADRSCPVCGPNR